MRKLFFIVVIALALPLAGLAEKPAKPVPGTQISMLINEYRFYDGFEAVKVGRLGTKIVKALIQSGAAHEDDPDLKDVKAPQWCGDADGGERRIGHNAYVWSCGRPWRQSEGLCPLQPGRLHADMPLRLHLPGFSNGRSVKVIWITKSSVTSTCP